MKEELDFLRSNEHKEKKVISFYDRGALSVLRQMHHLVADKGWFWMYLRLPSMLRVIGMGPTISPSMRGSSMSWGPETPRRVSHFGCLLLRSIPTSGKWFDILDPEEVVVEKSGVNVEASNVPAATSVVEGCKVPAIPAKDPRIPAILELDATKPTG